YFGDDFRVRKVTVPGGVVSFVTGSNSYGSADGAPGTAQFSVITDVALDAGKQNLYVSDQLNNTIRKVVLATGVVSTVAGHVGHAVDAPGPLSSAMLNHPQKLVVSPTGDLLVTTPREESILQIRLP
ncbi:MAG TPA: hypothetical protein VF334_23195, partial [Polyangia bacterium]